MQQFDAQITLDSVRLTGKNRSLRIAQMCFSEVKIQLFIFHYTIDR